MNWTRVEDALPANDLPVLIVTTSECMNIGFYSANTKSWHDYEAYTRNQRAPFTQRTVTHWQSLPPLPTGNEV